MLNFDICSKFVIKKLVFFQLIYIFIILFFISVFNLPSYFTLLSDFISMYLLFALIINKKFILRNNVINFSVFFFFSYCIMSGSINLANGSNIFFLIWGLRNIFRFYILFYSCLFSFDELDVKKFNKIYSLFFWINFIITLLQYFIFGLRGDYLGGIFGVEQGCNGYTNIFITIYFILTIIKLKYKQTSLNYFILVIFSLILISILSEIKFFYIELIIILFVFLLRSKITISNIHLYILSFLAILVVIPILYSIIPNYFEILFDSKKRDQYLNYSWINTLVIGRTNAFQVITNYFFKNNFFNVLFGMGFGTGETSSILSSNFYIKYGYMQYRNFSFSFAFLQNGLIGMILYFSFYLSIFYFIFKIPPVKKTKFIENIDLFYLVLITILLNYWYNDSMSVEIAYFTFIFLAVTIYPFKNCIINDK